MSLKHIPYIIPVLSGKGGVGKSSVTTQLALSLSLAGHNVGVLDIDLTGPSIPRTFGIEASKVRQAPGGWLPVEVSAAKPAQGDDQAAMGSITCMSLGFLLRDRGDAVIWRGPKKTAMVKQLLTDVLWPRDTEYLLIDTPPGTSDEHISLLTALLDPEKVLSPPQQYLAAVIVTTPQAIATADVKKELSFCKKVGLKVLGVVENMAGYVCPCCGEVSNVFSKGGGQVMAIEWAVKFLGSAPLDPEGWGGLVEEGKKPNYGKADANGTANPEQSADTMAAKYRSCALYDVFSKIVGELHMAEAVIPTPPAD